MRQLPQVLGHWHTTFEGFSTSALDFYELVKAGIVRREIPDLKISEVEWKESGLGSGKRIYLRVSREGLNYDICAAPFGTGYFFSSWLARISRPLLDATFILLALAMGGALVHIFSSPENGESAGMFSGVGGLVVFFGLLFALGALVRYGDVGLESTVLSMPVTGFVYGLTFRPVTYFNEDTAIVFRESVHQAVLEAIDQVTTAQGVRGLSEEARKITFKPEKER